MTAAAAEATKAAVLICKQQARELNNHAVSYLQAGFTTQAVQLLQQAATMLFVITSTTSTTAVRSVHEHGHQPQKIKSNKRGYDSARSCSAEEQKENKRAKTTSCDDDDADFHDHLAAGVSSTNDEALARAAATQPCEASSYANNNKSLERKPAESNDEEENNELLPPCSCSKDTATGCSAGLATESAPLLTLSSCQATRQAEFYLPLYDRALLLCHGSHVSSNDNDITNDNNDGGNDSDNDSSGSYRRNDNDGCASSGVSNDNDNDNDKHHHRQANANANDGDDDGGDLLLIQATIFYNMALANHIQELDDRRGGSFLHCAGILYEMSLRTLQQLQCHHQQEKHAGRDLGRNGDYCECLFSSSSFWLAVLYNLAQVQSQLWNVDQVRNLLASCRCILLPATMTGNNHHGNHESIRPDDYAFFCKNVHQYAAGSELSLAAAA